LGRKRIGHKPHSDSDSPPDSFRPMISTPGTGYLSSTTCLIISANLCSCCAARSSSVGLFLKSCWRGSYLPKPDKRYPLSPPMRVGRSFSGEYLFESQDKDSGHDETDTNKLNMPRFDSSFFHLLLPPDQQKHTKNAAYHHNASKHFNHISKVSWGASISCG
jgi:hypothetical protein